MLSYTFLAQALLTTVVMGAITVPFHSDSHAPGMIVLSVPEHSVPIAAPGVYLAPPHEDDEDLAGVELSSVNGTYDFVLGTFEVPSVHSPGDSFSGAYTWIGIDGVGCGYVALQVGLRIVAYGDEANYAAWYRWYPGPEVVLDPSDIRLLPGDTIHLGLVTFNTTAGIVTIINTSSNDATSIPVSGPALCRQGVEWMVEVEKSSGAFLPLVDFGVFNYTGAVVGLKDGGVADPTSSDGVVYDIVQNGTQFTETTVGRLNVEIKYAR